MVSVLHRVIDPSDGPAGYMFFCPGCQQCHAIFVDKPNPSNGCQWGFNGNMEKPTFIPSYNIPGQCHCFIRDGNIEFLIDCSHHLAGQTLPLSDINIEESGG